MSTALAGKQCQRQTSRLENNEIRALSGHLHSDWSVAGDGREIQRSFRFQNYYETLAFVNALAWIAHHQDHHPNLEVSYNRCIVHYSTHSVGGLSENDFICAAKIDELASPGA